MTPDVLTDTREAVDTQAMPVSDDTTAGRAPAKRKPKSNVPLQAALGDLVTVLAMDRKARFLSLHDLEWSLFPAL
jgi:hypothetical protein